MHDIAFVSSVRSPSQQQLGGAFAEQTAASDDLADVAGVEGHARSTFNQTWVTCQDLQCNLLDL